MSSVSFIAATQPPTTVTSVKPTAPQAVAADQPQPAANTSSSVTISPSATSRVNYEQRMAAETSAGYAQMRVNNVSGSNLTSPVAAQSAYDFAHANLTDGMGAETGGSGMVDVSVGYDLRGTLPGGDGILRYSNGGEPVTPESQTYWKQQATSFHNDLLNLYNSEVAKKTPPGEILNKFIDLKSQQPERFRSMMMWPSAADIANNSAGVIYGNEKLL